MFVAKRKRRKRAKRKKIMERPKKTRKNVKGAELFPEPDFLLKKHSKVTSTNATLYRPEYARQVFFLALLGLSDYQICQVLDIERGTLMIWKKSHSEFYKSIREGKVLADANVAHAMYQAAIGYSHEDTVVLTNRKREYDARGRVIREWTEPLIVPVTKHYPPNVTAGSRWLAARQRHLWSERVQVDGHVNVSHQLNLTDFSTEELEMLSKVGFSQQKKKQLNEQNEEYADYTEVDE